jgi:hypothetical protein
MVQFDHTSGNIPRSLNITDERSDQLDALVMYNIINQGMMIRQLFDSPDDAPANMRTKTGVLERCFESTNNEAERIYLVWEYAKLDVRLDKDVKLQAIMSGMAMLYDAVNGDEDKFVEKFVSFKNKAKGMMSGSDEDDE